MYECLFQKFEELFLELLVHETPLSLMKDLEFFITEPYMTATCRTNIVLAFRIGRELENVKGINYILVRSIHALFLARDSMLKLSPPAAVQELLSNSESLLKAYKLCRLLETNYG